MKPPPSRIPVIGTSGTGKTTVSTEIARRLNIPHIELDALHWRQGWKGTPVHEFREIVEDATTDDSWVVDGNYSRVRDIVCGKQRRLSGSIYRARYQDISFENFVATRENSPSILDMPLEWPLSLTVYGIDTEIHEMMS